MVNFGRASGDSPFATLPLDILRHLSTFTDVKTVLTMSSVCKSMQQLGSDEEYWEMAYRSDWQGQRFSTSPSQRAQLARQLSSAFSSALVGGIPRTGSQRPLGGAAGGRPQSLADRFRGLFGLQDNAGPPAPTTSATASNPISEWGAAAPLRAAVTNYGSERDGLAVPPPPAPPGGGRGMLSLYRAMSMDAGRNTSDRNYKELYIQRLRDQKAERLALRQELKTRRSRLSAIKCSTLFAPAVDMVVTWLGPIWMLLGVIITLFLVAAKLEGQLPLGAHGWWIVGGPTIFATGSLFLNVFVAFCVECCDPEGLHRGTLSRALCRCCDSWCRSACTECRTITRNSPVGTAVREIAGSDRSDAGDVTCGLAFVNRKAGASHAVLLSVPLLSFIGTIMVTARLAGDSSMSYTVALIPWMIASFQAFAIVGIEIGDIDDSEDIIAVSAAFFVSLIQFSSWLLIGLYADGSLGGGSACLAGIPLFTVIGCGSIGIILGTCAAFLDEIRDLYERSIPMAIGACCCAIPCVFIPAAAAFSPFLLPAVQLCLTFDNDMDPSEAGIAGQDNWYQVFAGWLFLLLAMCPAIGGAVSAVATEGNEFRPENWLPCCSTMCWFNLDSTERGRALRQLAAGLDDEGQ